MMFILKKIYCTLIFYVFFTICLFEGLFFIIIGKLSGKNNEWCRLITISTIIGGMIRIMSLAGIWNIHLIDKTLDKKYTIIKENYNTMRNSGQSYIIVSNNLSIFDLFFLLQLPFNSKIIWNKKLLFIPIIGILFYISDNIPNTYSEDVYNNCISTLNQRKSIIIFPESEYSDGQSLTPFRSGAFKLSVDTAVKILPITIQGAQKICNKGIFDFTEINITIDEPIYIEQKTRDDIMTEITDKIQNNTQNNIINQQEIINNAINIMINTIKEKTYNIILNNLQLKERYNG